MLLSIQYSLIHNVHINRFIFAYIMYCCIHYVARAWTFNRTCVFPYLGGCALEELLMIPLELDEDPFEFRQRIWVAGISTRILRRIFIMTLDGKIGLMSAYCIATCTKSLKYQANAFFP